MKTLEDQMSFYAAYHQDPRNKATHFVGVPTIVLSLMIPMGWLRLEAGGASLTAAFVVAAMLVAYYLALDAILGIAMGLVFAAMLWLAEALAPAASATGAAWFLGLFVGGWALQLWGHVFEGRKPALADNLFQVFVAPIFLCAEAFFALGYKPALRDVVQRRAEEMRRAAGIAPGVAAGPAT